MRWIQRSKFFVTAVMTCLVAIIGFSFANPVAANAAVSMAKGQEEIPSIFTPEEYKRYKLLPENDKNAVRDAVQADHAQRYCGDFSFYTTLAKGGDCEKFVQEALRKMSPTADQALGIKPAEMSLCEAFSEQGANAVSVKVCEAKRWFAMMKVMWPYTKEVLKLNPAIGGLIFGYDIVKFVADPKTPLDNLANQAKDESIQGTQKVLEQITSSNSFDPGDEGFRELWSIYAGVGVLLLALMTILLYKSYSDGNISDDNFFQTMCWWLPISGLLVIYGPALMSVANTWSSDLESDTSTFAAERISAFIQVVARFAALEQTGYFGPFMALIFFGIMLIGAWGILIFLLMVPAFQYLLGASLAVVIALYIHPKTRPMATKVTSVVLLLTFLKPLLLLVLGGAFQWAGSRPVFMDGYEDDSFATIASVAVIACFMIAIALTPGLLLRFMPVVNPNDADVGGNPGIAGGAIDAGASGVTQSIRQNRGGGRSGGSSGNRAGDSHRPGTPASPGSPTSEGSSNTSGSAGNSANKSTQSAPAKHVAGSAPTGSTGHSRTASGPEGKPAAPSVASSGGAGRGAAVASSVSAPIKAGTAGVLAAARDTARRSRESSGRMVPDSWNTPNNDSWQDGK